MSNVWDGRMSSEKALACGGCPAPRLNPHVELCPRLGTGDSRLRPSSIAFVTLGTAAANYGTLLRCSCVLRSPAASKAEGACDLAWGKGAVAHCHCCVYDMI